MTHTIMTKKIGHRSTGLTVLLLSVWKIGMGREEGKIGVETNRRKGGRGKGSEEVGEQKS